MGHRIFGSTSHTVGGVPKSSCAKWKMKLSSVQGQLGIRAEEILPPALFPFSLQSIFLLLENIFKSSENPFAASLGFRSQIFKDISYFVCLA